MDTASVSVSIPKYSRWEKYASSQERDGQEAEIKGKGSWPIGLAQCSAETFLQKLVQAKHFGLLFDLYQEVGKGIQDRTPYSQHELEGTVLQVP